MIQKQETLTFRIDAKLKRNFELSCEEADTTSSAALRNFIREFIEKEFDKKCKKIALDDDISQDSLHTDSRTGIWYSPREPDDVKLVKRTIALLNAFEARHKTKLMNYKDREIIKAKGNQLAKEKGLPLEQRVHGAELVMEAHFSRSAISSLNTDEPFSYLTHPGFEEYKQHYVTANFQDISSIGSYDSDIVKFMRAKHPPLEGLIHIKSGQTYWETC